METPIRRAPLPGLTALRFFAATYVLLSHFLPAPPGSDPAHLSLSSRLVSAGFTAVSCFFILSGFILAYTHEHVPQLGRFFRARFARIYPLYVFALLVSLPIFFKFLPLLPGSSHPLWAIPIDFLLIQDWMPRYAHSINSPAWTLSCEAFFYLLFPFAVRPIARYRGRLLPLLAACWLLQLLPPLFNALWLSAHAPAWSSVLSDVLSMPIGRLGEFLAGIVLGIGFVRRRSGGSLAGGSHSGWLLVASVALCVLFLSLNLIVPKEVMADGIMLGPYCLLVWALAVSNSRLLASRPLQLGGEISYGVYLLQMPFAHLLFLLGHHTHGWISGRWWMLALYPAAWMTYVAIEKPCRALMLHRRPGRLDKPIPTPQPRLP